MGLSCEFKRLPKNKHTIDLHMEHLNSTLKGIMLGFGANICEKAIVMPVSPYMVLCHWDIFLINKLK